MTLGEELQKKGNTSREDTNNTFPSKPFDLPTIYHLDYNKAIPNIKMTTYSNLAYIQVSQRDVYIDFLSMPGYRNDDKVMIDSVRVYMSYAAAQSLSEVLNKILKDIHSKGLMEQYKSKKNSALKEEK